MSIVWTLIASFLYAEIVVVLLLVLPIASAQRWQRFFRSRFLQMINRQAQMYFFLLLGVLLLFLLDAIREMRKYAHIDPTAERHDLGMQHSMRMFRAQRNFYISGFTMFLVLVIRRLVILISQQAAAADESEVVKRQAASATSAARTLLSQQKLQEELQQQPAGRGDETDRTMENQRIQFLVEELGRKLNDTKDDLAVERITNEALRTQVDHLEADYDDLADKYSTLENMYLDTDPNWGGTI